ncbi:MAG: DNA-binding response regulator [Geminicoccaceae bacterium]|nr:MAG: DNA-binding response regulator [Geminicoccaceae bacterium]
MTEVEAPPLPEHHLLVVDDDERLRTLLQRFLMQEGYHVTTAGSVGEARAALERFAVDLVVLDVMLPDATGFELTAEWRAKSDVPILLLTARKEVDDRIRGLEVGADDYLTKPFEPRELALRVRRILERAAPPAGGDAGEPADAVRFGPFVFDLKRQTLMARGVPVHLTTGERQLLATLARNPGVPFDRLELTDLADINGADRAVDAQVARLRRKLEPDPKQPRYLVTVRGRGYALQEGG